MKIQRLCGSQTHDTSLIKTLTKMFVALDYALVLRLKEGLAGNIALKQQ